MSKKTIATFLCLFALLLITISCSQSATEKAEDKSDNSEVVGKKDSEDIDSNEIDAEKEDAKVDTESDKTEEKSENDGKVYTPTKGSAEREAIFNALRVPIEKELKQEIVFAPDNFKVFGDWAFIGGEPLTKAGKKPDYKGTKYQEDVEADMFDNNFFALLKKDGSNWKVIKYYVGCTDVCYLGWDSEFKAPKQIFP